MRKTCGKYLPKDEYCPAIFCSIPFFHEQKSGFFVVSADWKKRDWWLQMNPPLKRTLHCLLSNWLHATPQPQEKIDAELFCKTVTKKKHTFVRTYFFRFFLNGAAFFFVLPSLLFFFFFKPFSLSLELRSRYQKIPLSSTKIALLKNHSTLGMTTFFRKQESCWKSLVESALKNEWCDIFQVFCFVSLFVSRFLLK